MSGAARCGAARARLLAVLVAMLVVAAASLAGAVSLVDPAAAHTDLLQGSPGPSQRVGGIVDFVDLVFLAPVAEAEIELTGPDGEAIPGQTEVSDGQIIRFRMPPLETPGSYRVTYRMRSDDGDDTESGYLFTYQPGALQPIRFGDAAAPSPQGDSAVTGLRIVGAALALTLIGVCGLLVLRLARRRSELAELARRADSAPGS